MATDENKMVHQLDDVTKESEEKATEIFDIIESKTASNIELAFLNKDAYTPLENVISTNTIDKRDVIVNSSNYISTNETLTRKFLNFGVGIENMEFFSV